MINYLQQIKTLKLQLIQELNNNGTSPLIYFKTDTTIGNKPNKEQDLMIVKIKTQPGEKNQYSLILRPNLQYHNIQVTIEFPRDPQTIS